MQDCHAKKSTATNKIMLYLCKLLVATLFESSPFAEETTKVYNDDFYEINIIKWQVLVASLRIWQVIQHCKNNIRSYSQSFRLSFINYILVMGGQPTTLLLNASNHINTVNYCRIEEIKRWLLCLDDYQEQRTLNTWSFYGQFGLCGI